MFLTARKIEKSRLEEFGPLPTVRQQLLTLLLSGTAMICISGTMDYFGLL